MNSRSAEKIKFTSFDELFNSSDIQNKEPGDIQEIPLKLLHTFHSHPYHVLDDEQMEELVESIRQRGVLNPGLARKQGEGYELISGHRRKRACELAGKKTMPIVVKELTDDEAAILVVDSNLYREVKRPSEKAKAYRLKMDTLKHQGKKGEQLTAALIGSHGNESVRTVFRLIRLTYLIPELLECVDEKRLMQTSAESISFLREEEQKWVLDVINQGITLGKKQALELKKASEQKKLSPEMVEQLLKCTSGKKAITLSAQRIQEFFPEGYSKEQMEAIIYELLDSWKKAGGNWKHIEG